VRDRPYGSWTFDEKRLQEITAEGARDLVVEWFGATQRAHFEATKSALGVSAHDAAIARTVKGAVRLAFRRAGGSFDHPTREALTQVVDLLAGKSLGWGAPEGEVLAHRTDIMRVVSRVPPTAQ
jgi:hypothetical protein